MKKILFILLIFSGTSLFAQDFRPVTPDTTLLWKLQEKSNYENSIGLRYLQTYYKQTGKKDTLMISKYDTMAYKMLVFNNKIRYLVHYKSSEEDTGTMEHYIFPKMPLSEIKALVQLLFYSSWNTWTSETTYEPDGAGCYCNIIQESDRTVVEVFCGC